MEPTRLRPGDAEAWATIAPFLDHAMDLEPAARAAWLVGLETTQAELARTLREMLSEREALNAKGFLSGSALPPTRLDTLVPMLAQMLPSVAQSIAAEGEAPAVSAGAVLGPYRLLREIGHGGMSYVWLAERCDGHLTREVALKLPFTGPGRVQMAERFKRERDILATLTHPNIARLYDAGVSAQGQPYLAMEYVNGTAITRYCDLARLSIRERLKLFLQVLTAVEFAHTHLILHRDLKPSNILVTERGRVVLLDFGIAKLISHERRPETPITEFAGRILTPDYAAPEHISGGSLGTTADVYSLGVVLFELLAGSRPFGQQPDSPRALEDAILTRTAPRPSQLAMRAGVAAARNTMPGKLAHLLEGDLDTIVLKALKKAPHERYQSIDAFARDISNYLGNRPVSARPDSAWYRSRRFVTRYRWQVAAVSVMLFAIVAGGATSMWQASVAARQLDRAVALSSRNVAINDFMKMLIIEAASSEKPVTVSEMLDRSEKLALARTGDRPEDRAAILYALAGLYDSTEDFATPARLLERALELTAGTRDTSLRSQLVCHRAVLIGFLGELDAARDTLTRELRNPALDHRNAASCLANLALIEERTGDADAVLLHATKALAHFYQAEVRSLTDEASILSRVATGHRLKGDNTQANHYFGLAFRKYVEAGRERSPATIILRSNWALVSTTSGAPRRALELYDQVLALATERVPGAAPPATVVHNRGRALEEIGRFAQARSAYELSSELAEQMKNVNLHVFSLLGLASVAAQTGDRAQARRYLAQAEEVAGPSEPTESPPHLKRMAIQGALDLAEGNLRAARAAFDPVIATKRMSPSVFSAALGQAQVELLEGHTAAAVSRARAVLDMATRLQGGIPHSHYTGRAWLMLGRALRASGEVIAAREGFEAAAAHLSNTVDGDHPELLQARELLASDRAPLLDYR
jgi:serine/threonine protein kinase